MHTRRAGHRGRGVGAAILAHIVSEAAVSRLLAPMACQRANLAGDAQDKEHASLRQHRLRLPQSTSISARIRITLLGLMIAGGCSSTKPWSAGRRRLCDQATETYMTPKGADLHGVSQATLIIEPEVSVLSTLCRC
jgi:hypothetical protein